MKQLPENKEFFDVAVIGGGPAGMMASGRAAEVGAKVILIEKNRTLGRKIMITGKGRCNITHAEFDPRILAKAYGKCGDFLLTAFFRFGPKEVIDFFESRGLKTKTERGQRVFPISDKAQDVIDVLTDYIKKSGVRIITGKEVTSIEREGNIIKSITVNSGKISAKNYIFCTGGKSYPVTGSTGDGFLWSEKMGHHVIAPLPALVPIKTKEKWVTDLQGLSLKNVELSIVRNNKKQDLRFGEMLFTHFGISGPIVLDISKRVGEFLKEGEVKLSIDLKPALDNEKLDARILRDFRKDQNKMFKNALEDLLPQKLISEIIRMSGIRPEKPVNIITREEREKLVSLLKNLTFTASGLLGFEIAIVTAGGIDLKEIDPRAMRSKLIENLFFAGEVINIDGPTGGYNLQQCWSTGRLAGEKAAGYKDKE